MSFYPISGTHLSIAMMVCCVRGHSKDYVASSSLIFKALGAIIRKLFKKLRDNIHSRFFFRETSHFC